MRKDKPMAWLVGELFMQQISTFIEHAIDHDPALADSLAITFDHDIAAVIKQGDKEKKEKKLLPIEKILDD